MSEEFEAAHVQELVKQIEKLDEEKESAHGVYMNKCGKINDRKNAVFDQGSRRGIDAKAARTLMKIRKQRAKAQAILAQLDEDHRQAVAELARANNDPSDLPLFKSAPRLELAAE